MAWIKLSDDYCDHPKFTPLSDGAFRLWHQVLGFCRKYKTDGLVPTVTLRGLKAYSPKRARELLTPWCPGAQPLWHEVEGFGIQLHDYLDWNASKDEDVERRADSKERMRQLREDRRFAVGVPPVSTNSSQTDGTCSHDVPGMGREGIVLDLQKKEERGSEFDQFWAAYPRKTGKEAARRAWTNRSNIRPDLQTILDALAWQKQQDQWLRDGGAYVPHPATWLNQGRWSDEPQTTPRISERTLAMARATQEFLQS
jgi:hypothetical protein